MNEKNPKDAALKISRWEPGKRENPFLQEYIVPWEKGLTVLAALIWIRENLDPSLSFRFSCRFKHCGLCAMEINGKPRLACLTKVSKDTVIKPLPKLPVIRDLVVDRQPLFDLLSKNKLYIPENAPGGRDYVVIDSVDRQRLSACIDCLACVSSCPHFSAEENFGGPYLFVKLAQLHLDKRDNHDRRLQARELGIKRCQDCRSCRCINGLSIYQDALIPLLGL
ncbi:MAG: succinate dehydrogenase/fumarate reductase iron-sulfur subunit [Bacillota bacterium]